jgi:hypothetical protein
MATAVKQDAAQQQANGNLAPAPDVEESTGSRRWILLTAVAVPVAVGLTWGYRQWSYGRAHESTGRCRHRRSPGARSGEGQRLRAVRPREPTTST